jgi:hypothetical protein
VAVARGRDEDLGVGRRRFQDLVPEVGPPAFSEGSLRMLTTLYRCALYLYAAEHRRTFGTQTMGSSSAAWPTPAMAMSSGWRPSAWGRRSVWSRTRFAATAKRCTQIRGNRTFGQTVTGCHPRARLLKLQSLHESCRTWERPGNNSAQTPANTEGEGRPDSRIRPDHRVLPAASVPFYSCHPAGGSLRPT